MKQTHLLVLCIFLYLYFPFCSHSDGIKGVVLLKIKASLFMLGEDFPWNHGIFIFPKKIQFFFLTNISSVAELLKFLFLSLFYLISFYLYLYLQDALQVKVTGFIYTILILVVTWSCRVTIFCSHQNHYSKLCRTRWAYNACNSSVWETEARGYV